jgi:DNA-directed RNA polymerase specialized sigma24 family protein
MHHEDMAHKRKKRRIDDGSPVPASDVSSPPAPEDPAPEDPAPPPPELNSAEEADDEDEPLCDAEPFNNDDDEHLNDEELAAYMECIGTISEQEAELDHLHYLADRQRRWIDALHGEFTAGGQQSSHLLT